MKRIVLFVVVVAGASAAVAAALLVDWDPEHARREAFVYHCNEEGAGGMITSRDYCDELYERSRKRGAVRSAQ
jgi:hypothetical protein